MLAEGKAGPRQLSDGTTAEARLGKTGEVISGDAHARYWEAVQRGNVYRLVLAATATVAYSGAAAGTPIFSIQNLSTTGKTAIILGVGQAITTAASAAGSVSLALFGAINSVVNTTSLVAATNVLTQAASGSAMQCTINTALLASSGAATLALPLSSYYWATAAGAFATPQWFDVGGLVVAVPGTIVTLGNNAALTSAAYSYSIVWEEVNA